MRFSPSLVLGISTMVFALAACGDDGGTAGAAGSGGAGAGGGDTSTVATTTTTSVTGPAATTGSGMGMCDGSPFGDPCGPCLEGACCQELIDDGGSGMSQELFDCANANCSAECFPPQEPPFPLECMPPATAPSMGACVMIDANNVCNPVTNEGCNTAAGEACDGGMNGFQCYPDGNTQDLCQECGVTGSDYCKAGSTCLNQCAKYCCDDSDCGAGTCTKTLMGSALFMNAPNLGVCAQAGGGTGGGGVGGAMP